MIFVLITVVPQTFKLSDTLLPYSITGRAIITTNSLNDLI